MATVAPISSTRRARPHEVAIQAAASPTLRRGPPLANALVMTRYELDEELDSIAGGVFEGVRSMWNDWFGWRGDEGWAGGFASGSIPAAEGHAFWNRDRQGDPPPGWTSDGSFDEEGFIGTDW